MCLALAVWLGWAALEIAQRSNMLSVPQHAPDLSPKRRGVCEGYPEGLKIEWDWNRLLSTLNHSKHEFTVRKGRNIAPLQAKGSRKVCVPNASKQICIWGPRRFIKLLRSNIATSSKISLH